MGRRDVCHHADALALAFWPATGAFGALQQLNRSAAQPAVCGGLTNVYRRPALSFSLVDVGGWKATCVSVSVASTR